VRLRASAIMSKIGSRVPAMAGTVASAVAAVMAALPLSSERRAIYFEIALFMTGLIGLVCRVRRGGACTALPHTALPANPEPARAWVPRPPFCASAAPPFPETRPRRSGRVPPLPGHARSKPRCRGRGSRAESDDDGGEENQPREEFGNGIEDSRRHDLRSRDNRARNRPIQASPVAI
jgi:hypothetical protein